MKFHEAVFLRKNFWGVDKLKMGRIIFSVALERGRRSEAEKSFKTSETAKNYKDFSSILTEQFYR